MSQISKMAPILALAAASLALTFAFAGCNKSAPDNTAQTQPGAAPADQNQDPAASANLAARCRTASNLRSAGPQFK